MCVCVSACVCVCARVRVRVHACAHVCSLLCTLYNGSSPALVYTPRSSVPLCELNIDPFFVSCYSDCMHTQICLLFAYSGSCPLRTHAPAGIFPRTSHLVANERSAMLAERHQGSANRHLNPAGLLEYAGVCACTFVRACLVLHACCILLG